MMRDSMSQYNQLVSFAAFGMVATLLHFSILIALVDMADYPPPTATVFGFLAGAVCAYMLNQKYTFKRDRWHFHTASKFLFVATLTGSVNFLFLKIGTDCLALNYILVQSFLTFILFVVNFLVNRKWTFRKSAGRML